MEQPLEGPLADLARWTGGEIFVGVSPSPSCRSTQRDSIVDGAASALFDRV